MNWRATNLDKKVRNASNFFFCPVELFQLLKVSFRNAFMNCLVPLPTPPPPPNKKNTGNIKNVLSCFLSTIVRVFVQDFFGKSDPYLEFEKGNPDNTFSPVHRTEVCVSDECRAKGWFSHVWTDFYAVFFVIIIWKLFETQIEWGEK